MKKRFNYSELISLFETAIQQAENFKLIPANIITLKPNPSSWSAGEIFEHIVRFNMIYQRNIDRTLDKGPLFTTVNPSFSPRLLINYFIKTTRPPYKLKIKTLTPMKPKESRPEEFYSFLDQLVEMNGKFIKQIQEFEVQKLDLDRVRGKNPVFKFKMSITEFLLMLDAHQQRHFWQTDNTLLKLTGER